ncbi:uncharacterized protein LOC123548837 [Mercenaria mercenaria]|uniref:uncharacterized protein LOC123548837 n=1 Tax=Mercenaria mercenaria TaxID=6596 RepID=UPI00234ED497|nr:uncharacterized protein LOC123548837 [Mercenaria mercenaria]
MEGRIETDIRAKAVEQYKVLSAVHFGMGFLLLFFASYTAMNIHGEGNGTFPYYLASIISSIGIIIVSIIGVAIYDRGQHECGAELVPLVKPLLKVHFVISLLVTVTFVAGCILTIVYGLCPSNTCSYSTNYTFNYGMAAFLLGLQVLSMSTSILSIIMFRHYRKHFVVHPKFSSHVEFENDM